MLHVLSNMVFVCPCIRCIQLRGCRPDTLHPIEFSKGVGTSHETDLIGSSLGGAHGRGIIESSRYKVKAKLELELALIKNTRGSNST